MPIYEYRCSECGHQEEHLQKVSEAPLAQCPACGKNTYRKLLSAAGFQLKGSGWYATDFKGGEGKGRGCEKRRQTRNQARRQVRRQVRRQTPVQARRQAEVRDAGLKGTG
jgi:putative FmdB family regulatory protein